MNAKDTGYTRGREYLRSYCIEKLTFQEYRNLGRVDAKKQYKQDKARDAYLLGWWQAGEQFLMLFKQTGDNYQTQKSVQSVRVRMESLIREVEEILEAQEDGSPLQHMLQHAYEGLDEAQIALNNVNAYLRYPQEREGGKA
jgi:hypothetical protein